MLRLDATLAVPSFNQRFHNGTAQYKARETLCLSKAFMQEQKDFKLELKVEVININHPDNKDFLLSCEILKEYGVY